MEAKRQIADSWSRDWVAYRSAEEALTAALEFLRSAAKEYGLSAA